MGEPRAQLCNGRDVAGRESGCPICDLGVWVAAALRSGSTVDVGAATKSRTGARTSVYVRIGSVSMVLEAMEGMGRCGAMGAIYIGRWDRAEASVGSECGMRGMA